ncbi:transcription factor S [Candidatus Woesearchaeota archaeon]|nr:transcription factor S [Candidatus Woesearchaeota archaeon]
MFCPKCGSLLMPKVIKNEKVTACSCGYTNKTASGAGVLKETVQGKRLVGDVVSEDQDDAKLPKTRAECNKCGSQEAYLWTKQTRAGDEPETKFLKCVKCKHTWRDYS